MALFRCSECGGTVSDRAASCPHCGAPTASGGSEVVVCQHCEGTGVCTSHHITRWLYRSCDAYFNAAGVSRTKATQKIVCGSCNGVGRVRL